jgi:hypothetical protein
MFVFTAEVGHEPLLPAVPRPEGERIGCAPGRVWTRDLSSRHNHTRRISSSLTKAGGTIRSEGHIRLASPRA